MQLLKRVASHFGTVCLLCIVLLCTGCAPGNDDKPAASMAQAESAAQSAEIKMLDIGQGDALLIKVAGQVIMVDTGDTDMREQLVKLLKQEKITVIDKLIMSHPHADHLGGAFAVFNNFTVNSVYDNGQSANTNIYRTYMKTIKKQNIPYRQLYRGDRLDLGGGAAFTVFSPTKADVKDAGDLNNNSIVGKFTFGDFSMLFTGDSEVEAEKAILSAQGKELGSTLLKSPHHGSKTSSNRNYLKMVAPEAVLISVGVGNDYKHPHAVTLNKYKDLKIKIYRTDTDGTVTVRTDGKTYQITKEK